MVHFKANSNIYLVINNGARVSKEKYYDFAVYISHNNINVITYDYTDLVTSTKYLKKSDTNIQTWVKSDLKRAISYVNSLNMHSKIFILGHSLGGQIVGLSEDYLRISGVILVATQTGYWKYWPFPLNVLNYLTWKLYIPSITKFYNFFPRGFDSNLRNIPQMAALEWAKWCLSKNYLFDHVALSNRYHHKITCPIFSISFDNDIYATRQAVDWFTAQHTNAPVTRKHYTSNKAKLGHSAAFEPSHFQLIGSDIINFIMKTHEQISN